MLKMALFDCAIKKNIAMLTEDGAFSLFSLPYPGKFDSSKVPSLPLYLEGHQTGEQTHQYLY